MSINIDCKLPYDLGKLIWSFNPYHDIHKEIFYELHYVIWKKKIINIIKNLEEYKGISLITINIEYIYDYYEKVINYIVFDLKKELNNKYKLYDLFSYKLINTNNLILKHSFNDTNKLYSRFELYDTYLKNKFKSFYKLDYILGDLFTNVLTQDIAYETYIYIEYYDEYSKFNPDNIFNLEWDKIVYNGCICGNKKKYKLNNDNMYIKIETQNLNFHRNYNLCRICS
jgi:hypothetical protein